MWYKINNKKEMFSQKVYKHNKWSYIDIIIQYLPKNDRIDQNLLKMKDSNVLRFEL